MEVLRVLLPFIEFFATAAGAGVAASWLFDCLRANVPQDRSYAEDSVLSAVQTALYDRGIARLFVIASAMVIGVVASVLLAAVAGEPILTALDHALAAALASQFVHLRFLLGTSTSSVVFTSDFHTTK